MGFFNSGKNLQNYRVKKNLKASIEPEEILSDATKPSELENQKIEVPIGHKTFYLFGVLVAIGFLILVGQAAYLQVIKTSLYQQLAQQNRTRAIPIFASRGIIYDRTQKPLVYNIPSFDLVVTWQDLPREQAGRAAVIEKAAAILGVSPEEIFEQLKNTDLKTTQSVSVASNLEHEKILALEAQLTDLPGFRIEKNAIRQYISASSFSHVLGYLGKLQAQDLKENPDYSMTEKIGKEGLERVYEKILRGQPGQQLIEIDSQGKGTGLVSETPPQPGAGLMLTIDGELQRELYERLGEVLKNLKLKKAVAVAIDPRDGAILSLISFPNFDNNLFAQGISSRDYDALENDAAKPFLNRVVSGQYAPGSTVKPLIGAAALQEKIVSEKTTIFDSGEITLVNQYNPEIVYHFFDWQAHGAVNIYSAIAQSCDVYFYTVGGGYGNIKGLGVERLKEYFNLFGLGAKLGIDLPAETDGLVPSRQWKESQKGEPWYTGDTYHLSIGQGDLLVTPLQLAAATASIVNGGKLYQPRLVDKIVDSDKNIIKAIEPKVLRENFIDSVNSEIIKRAMRQTVTAGSALLLNDLPVPVAGKTGTAQVAGQINPNAWFAGFAPYQNPEIVLVILVENAGEGTQVAVPIAKEVLEQYFLDRGGK